MTQEMRNKIEKELESIVSFMETLDPKSQAFRNLSLEYDGMANMVMALFDSEGFKLVRRYSSRIDKITGCC